MSTKVVSTHLGRGQSLIDRITRELKNVRGVAETNAAPVQIPAVDEVEVRVNLRRERFRLAHLRANELTEALVALRLAIAEGNTRAGIWALLAQDKIAKEKVSYLNGVIGNASVEDVVQVGSLPAILASVNARYGLPSVTVLEDSALQDLIGQLAAAKFDVDQIGDKINDLNTKTVLTFSIEESVAALIGL